MTQALGPNQRRSHHQMGYLQCSPQVALHAKLIRDGVQKLAALIQTRCQRMLLTSFCCLPIYVNCVAVDHMYRCQFWSITVPIIIYCEKN